MSQGLPGAARVHVRRPVHAEPPRSRRAGLPLSMAPEWRYAVRPARRHAGPARHARHVDPRRARHRDDIAPRGWQGRAEHRTTRPTSAPARRSSATTTSATSTFDWGPGDDKAVIQKLWWRPEEYPSRSVHALGDPASKRVALMAAEPDERPQGRARGGRGAARSADRGRGGPARAPAALPDAGLGRRRDHRPAGRPIDTALAPVPPLIRALTDGLDISDFPKILDALQKAGDAVAAVERIDGRRAGPVGHPGRGARRRPPELPGPALRRLRFPRIYALLTLATLIDVPDAAGSMIIDRPRSSSSTTGRATGGPLRPPARLFTEPDKLFKEVYWPDGITRQSRPPGLADRLFPRIAGADPVVRRRRDLRRRPLAGLTSAAGRTARSSPTCFTFSQPLPYVVAVDGAVVRSSVELSMGIVAPEGTTDTRPVSCWCRAATWRSRASSTRGLVEIDVDATAGGMLITEDGVPSPPTAPRSTPTSR